MKMLVTGANGFIGSHIVKKLCLQNQEVRAFIKKGTDCKHVPFYKDIEIVEGDIRDARNLEKSAKKVDGLYHLAAFPMLWDKNPKNYFEINVAGTQNVLSAANSHEIKKVVYTSTCDFLGREQRARGMLGNEGDFPENGNAFWLGPYSYSKWQAEMLVLQYARKNKTNGLEAVIVSPTLPLGANDISPTEPGKLVERIIRGNLFGYIQRRMNFVHVEDCADMHILAMLNGKSGERYIAGSDENILLGDFIEKVSNYAKAPLPKISNIPYFVAISAAYLMEIASMFSRKAPVASLEGVRLVKHSFAFSCDKAKYELGYAPRPVQEAIYDAVAWHCYRLGLNKNMPDKAFIKDKSPNVMK